jgi:endosialidase-like protein
VASGGEALFSNTTGISNVAIGLDALHDNNEGFSNVAIGNSALSLNTTGAENTAIGVTALASNVTGTWNTAVGSRAGLLITGDSNTVVGHEAGEQIGAGSGNVCVGNGVQGEADVDDSTYIRNINTTTQSFSPGANDYVTVRLSDGRLGHTTVVSSQRYKEDIKPLAAASRALYELKPVSFRLKKQFDPTQALGFGLIAEEVEKVNGDLVYRNDKGQVESVRYDMVNAMLLSEFLKEHQKVQEQEAMIARLKRDLENVLARLEDQDSKIQHVSDRIDLRETTQQVVSD